MGSYTVELTIPPNTSEDAPVKKDLIIEGAVFERIHFLIPAGHQSLARLAIFYGIRQIFPKQPGTWLKGEGESFSMKIGWRLPEFKVQITLKGWNEDDTYQHTFYLRLEVPEKVEEARPWQVIIDFVAILKKLIGLR